MPTFQNNSTYLYIIDKTFLFDIFDETQSPNARFSKAVLNFLYEAELMGYDIIFKVPKKTTEDFIEAFRHKGKEELGKQIIEMLRSIKKFVVEDVVCSSQEDGVRMLYDGLKNVYENCFILSNEEIDIYKDTNWINAAGASGCAIAKRILKEKTEGKQ